MTRITAPSHPGALASAALRSARRKTRKLTGLEDPSIEPVEAMAHAPAFMYGYGAIELGNERSHAVALPLKEMAVLKAATLVGCEFCIDIGSSLARKSGLSDEQLLALPRYRESGLFGELEMLVLDYAVAMSRTPLDVPDELFAALREHLSQQQLVELTATIALENFRARFNGALGIGAGGFSDGTVCAVPETNAAPATREPAVAPVS
jgi:4-carboxymuconolactone decarboxylase